MDLSLLVANDTADCTIVDPQTGLDSDVVITLLATHTKESEAAKAKAGDLTVVENLVQYLADITVGWVNVDFNKKELAFNRENAIKVYSHTGQVVALQVLLFIGNQKNFLPER